MVETSGRIFASRTAEGATDLRILEDIPLAVTVHDASGELVFANDAAVRDLGIGRGPEAEPAFEVFGESGDRLPPERLPGRVALKGTPTKSAMLRIRSAGVDRWAAVTAWPVIDDTGVVRF